MVLLSAVAFGFLLQRSTNGDEFMLDREVRCSYFETQAQAMAYFQAGLPGYQRLDGDFDGIPCESLP